MRLQNLMGMGLKKSGTIGKEMVNLARFLKGNFKNKSVIYVCLECSVYMILNAYYKSSNNVAKLLSHFSSVRLRMSP